MKAIFFILILFFFTISCINEKKPEEIIVKINEKQISSPFLSKLQPFSPIDKLPERFKGIVNSNIYTIQYLSLFDRTKLKKLNINSKINTDIYDNLKAGVYAYSGYEVDKQILIIDTNNNLDFSDEIKFEFDKNLKNIIKKNVLARDSFPIMEVNYQTYENERVLKKKILIRPLPYSNYFSYNNPTDKNKLISDLQLVAEINKYYYGEFRIAKNDYKVAINKSLFGYKFLIQDLNENFLNRRDKNYKVYNLADTLILSNSYYRIDSINVEHLKFYFKKLYINSKKYGHTIGEEIKDYKFTDIHKKITSLYNLTQDKKYLLIDFWGTWCEPCKELTPDIVKMNLNNSDNLNILSVAFDKNKEQVENYIKANNMNWHHFFIEGNAKNFSESPELIKDLRIEAYPTFILVSDENKIIYRGVGKMALDKIQLILEEQ